MLRLLLLLFFSIQLYSTQPINIASIDWCPQLCPKGEKRGYVIDILELVYKNSDYTLNITTYPWSRAITMTQNGVVDALLSPAKKEAPNLNYPKYPVGQQQMCFFVNEYSSWKYKGLNSLKGLRIGIAPDTSIEELNPYIKKNQEQFQYMPYNEYYLIKSFFKLERKRIDTFLFTKNSTLYMMSLLNQEDKYKIAGCVSNADIYIAFTPNPSSKERLENIINYFDTKMKKLKDSDEIKEIMQKYGLKP